MGQPEDTCARPEKGGWVAGVGEGVCWQERDGWEGGVGMGTLLRSTSCTFGADGTAFAVGDFWIGAVGRILANHFVAHNASAIADADLARLGFPNIFVVVELAVQRTATECACAEQQQNVWSFICVSVRVFSRR